MKKWAFEKRRVVLPKEKNCTDRIIHQRGMDSKFAKKKGQFLQEKQPPNAAIVKRCKG